MEVGQYNTLKINRETKIGLFLIDQEENEVFLPQRFMPKEYNLGEDLEVFVHNDSEGRIVCTTMRPIVVVNQFAMLECRDVTPVGAFMDIGIMKDILVPKKNQHFEPEIGKKYLVLVYLDHLSNRLVGTINMERVTENNPEDIDPGEEVEIIVWHSRDDGWRVIVNEEYLGMIFRDQVFQPIEDGMRLNGFVNRIREDGRIDVLLQRPGHENIGDSAEQILSAIKAADGFLPLTDKSTPEEISAALSMSKKSFKKGVGTLYKGKLILLEDKGLRLVESTKS